MQLYNQLWHLSLVPLVRVQVKLITQIIQMCNSNYFLCKHWRDYFTTKINDEYDNN